MLLAGIVAEAYRVFPLETGGILLGHNMGQTMTLRAVIGPGPEATHGRFSFDPDQAWQEKEVAHAWTAAGGKLDYLGDWHTHPNGRPHPSKVDIEALRRIRDAPNARAAKPIMLIVAPRGSADINVRAHELHSRRRGSAEVRVEVRQVECA